jgi:putative transposase
MKKIRFSEEQIIAVLKENEMGISVKEICRKHSISDATYYKWKAKFGGMNVSEARRLKQLEEENSRLKKLVANQAIDIDCLKEVLSKKW